MFDTTNHSFHCNNCQKEIHTGEKVWTKWQFPPKENATQLKARKELAFENAPILCLACAKELLAKEF